LVDRKLFSWHFEPIVQPGERVLLKAYKKEVYAEVTWVEPAPFVEVDMLNGTTLNPGAESEEREMQELYVNDNEFAQWRFMIETDNVILAAHKSPKAAYYYATKNAYPIVPPAGTYGIIEPIKRMQLTEFYQYKDTSRVMTIANIGSSPITSAKLAFFGYIFQIEELKGSPTKPYTVIPCIARVARKEA